MITKPTVFVLGAGASIPYGYPSGAGLLKEIVQKTVTSEWQSIFNAYGIQDLELNAFRTELHLSQKPSIDAFLEHRPEFMKVGKVAIALSLLSKESPDALLDYDVRDQGIYHYLYNSLTTSWEEFKENKLTVITFNYDRSLEHFLFSALKHSYNRSDTEVAEAIQSIPIIHLHGSLGPLPWQAVGGIDYYPLFTRGDGPYEFGKRIKVACENIVIVSEAQPQSQEFALAFENLKVAERIYFIGFGYYRVNLERLGIKKLDNLDSRLAESISEDDILAQVQFDRKGQVVSRSYRTNDYFPANKLYKVMRFRGSAFGLGMAEIQAIQNEWHIALPDNKSGSIQFLKQYADLS